MALIDKETIRAEIERLKQKNRPLIFACASQVSMEAGIKQETYNEILAFLDTLPEQPKLKPMNIPSAGGGISKEEFVAYARHFYELGQQSRPKISDNSLEEEYKDYVENDPVYSKLVNRNAGLGIASHFAEWGATHLKR